MTTTMPPLPLPEELDLLLQFVQKKHTAQFSLFFSNILKLSSLTAIILNNKAKEELWELVRNGSVEAEDIIEISQSSTHLTNVCSGARSVSRNTLTLWMRVLWKWHHSNEYRDLCTRHKIPQAVFDETHIQALFALAGYAVSAKEVEAAAAFADAYNAAVEVVKSSPIRMTEIRELSPSRQNTGRRRKVTLQPDTQPDLAAYRQAIENLLVSQEDGAQVL